MVPLIHVGGVECFPVGFPLFPLNAGVEDIQDVMKDFVEGELRLGAFLRSVYMGFNVTVEVFTRDFGRQAIVNERRGGGLGLCIHRPVLPDEGGLFESYILLSFFLTEVLQSEMDGV